MINVLIVTSRVKYGMHEVEEKGIKRYVALAHKNGGYWTSSNRNLECTLRAFDFNVTNGAEFRLFWQSIQQHHLIDRQHVVVHVLEWPIDCYMDACPACGSYNDDAASVRTKCSCSLDTCGRCVEMQIRAKVAPSS